MDNKNNMNLANIKHLSFWKCITGTQPWRIDATPIFQDRFGKEIVKTVTITLSDYYDDSDSQRISRVCEIMLEKFKKNPFYFSFSHNTEVKIVFTNGKEVSFEADDNELSIMC